MVTAKDLRFNVSMLFDMLDKGEDITITYRGKEKAKLKPINSCEQKDVSLFGIWSSRGEDVDSLVRNMRKGRNFDI